jgi:hypothetical protein
MQPIDIDYDYKVSYICVCRGHRNEGIAMHHNRINSLFNATAGTRFDHGQGRYTAPFAPAHPPTMVMVPCAMHQAPWQAQLYQAAYQQAVAQIAPRSFARNFSGLN